LDEFKTPKMSYNLSKYNSRTYQKFMCKGKWKFCLMWFQEKW